MSFPHYLTNLTTREAIADAIYRALAAFDESDADLLSSALTTDVVMQIQPGETMAGLDMVKRTGFARASPLTTSHFVSSVRINVKDDDATTASVTCNCLAQHYPPGQGSDPADTRRLLAGTKYLMDMVKADGDELWKIKKWVLQIVWVEGDLSVVAP